MSEQHDEPARVEFSARVIRDKQVLFESRIDMPLRAGANPKTIVESWVGLMQSALAFIKREQR